MNIEEEWRYVDGTPYEVSSCGRVRRGARILKPRLHSNGYHRVIFSIRANHTDHYVHRLVCTAFHGVPPTSQHHADHIDGTRTNNCATNVRWLSPDENRARRNCAKGERNGASKYTEATVRTILCRRARGETVKDIASDLSISARYVREIACRKVWAHVST